MLPEDHLRVALPPGMTATTIHIDTTKEQTLPGHYQIMPAQPPQTLNTPNTVPMVPPDATTYQSTTPYPTEPVILTDETDLAGQPIADLTIHPLQYIGATHQLTLLTTLTFTIEGTPGYICGDYLPTRLAKTDTVNILAHVKGMVINPDDVHLQTNPKPHTLGVPAGDYDYIIITSTAWASSFQPLADWRTKTGVPATIVTTDWIYNNGGYSGSNDNKIRAFVQDAYTTWGATFFLLGGDTGTIPCNYKTIPSVDSDPIPNDAYYADFDGDWTSEVNVGRASVTSTGTGTGGIGNFINKVLTYEQNPPANFATTAGFYGFDLDSSTHAQQCKIYIDDHYIPDTWTMTNVYDSDSGNHRSNVIASMNQGQNLLNHADHSASDYMGTGYINHNWGIDDSDMDNLNNGDRQGVLYSMGCDPCAYDSSACIAEHFVRNSNGGGLAFIGNSRYGWYNVGAYNTLSMKFDQYFFRSLLAQNHYKLGDAFTDHKNDGYVNQDIYKYCYTEITLLGDPGVPIWTNDPGTLTVNYPTELPVGTTSFIVTVTDGTNPVANATVCLMKDADVYLVGTTNAEGIVELTPSPTTPGTMAVTVTAHNFLPSENNATVILVDDLAPLTPSQPSGPTVGYTNRPYAYSTSTTDPDAGDQIWYQWQFGGTFTDWLGPFDSGTTVQTSFTWHTQGNYTIKVKAKDATGLQSPWSNPTTITITLLEPRLELGGIEGGTLAANTMLTSTGNTPATNVTWDITLQGGLVLPKHTAHGTIAVLAIGESIPIKISPVFGFGSVIITVTASADYAPTVSKNCSAFILLIWVGLT
jgi:hypothetical protein